LFSINDNNKSLLKMSDLKDLILDRFFLNFYHGQIMIYCFKREIKIGVTDFISEIRRVEN